MLFTVLMFWLALPASTKAYGVTNTISEECEECYVRFGEGTAETEYELRHDSSRFPLVADISCDASAERRDLDSAEVQFAGGVPYRPQLFNSSWAQLRLQLQPWQWGLLQLNLSNGCYYQRYLVTGRPPDDHVNWSCAIPLDADGSNRCRGSRGNSSMVLQIICQYQMTQLISLTSGGVLAANELGLRVQATHSFRSSTANDQYNITSSMHCTNPNMDAEGSCQTCWSTDTFNGRDSQSTSFTVKNLFGSASVPFSFVASDVVILEKPLLKVYCDYVNATAVKLQFFVNTTEAIYWLCTSGKTVEYRLSVKNFVDDSEPRIEAVSLPCVVCSQACHDRQIIVDSEKHNCSAECMAAVPGLRPATKYTYAVAWRPAPVGKKQMAPWSSTAFGTFETPESVPAASPATVPGGFEIRPCSLECDMYLDSATRETKCRAVRVYWQSIPLKERNGELTGISLWIESASANYTADLHRDRKNYTICSGASTGLLVRVTVATAVGKPAAQQWSQISIPGVDEILEPVTQVIAKEGPQKGSTQLWWYYREPVDSFLLLWKSTDNILHELNWTVVGARHTRNNNSDARWNYMLAPSHRLHSRWPHKVTYGIGATFRGTTSGLTFNSQCSIYNGLAAPDVQALEKPVAGSTSIRLTIKAASHKFDACSFAGPLKGFELKVTDDDSDHVAHDATCDGCKLGASGDNLHYKSPYYIQINNLTPNHRYGIMIRSLVDAGIMDVSGEYSKPVHAKTSGLTDLQTFGVACSVLVFGCLVWIAVIFLPQCHRALGFGQKVSVFAIRPDNQLPEGEAEALAEHTSMLGYAVTYDLLGRRSCTSVVDIMSARDDLQSPRLLEPATNGSLETCSVECGSLTVEDNCSSHGCGKSWHGSRGFTIPQVSIRHTLVNTLRDDNYIQAKDDARRSESSSLPYLCHHDFLPALVGISHQASEVGNATNALPGSAAHASKVGKQVNTVLKSSDVLYFGRSCEQQQQGRNVHEVSRRSYPDLGYCQASDIPVGPSVAFLDPTVPGANIATDAAGLDSSHASFLIA